MTDKKEIQDTITKEPEDEETSEEEFFNVLRTVAPGTNLRASLNGALKTGKGAMIAIENDKLLSLIDGGFRINARFTPQRLVELTKMDGAIILSKDMKKINYANVLLTPDSKIKSNETGTRHKAAERTAKQTGNLVIAISERKHEINIYYKKIKHLLVQTDELLRKTSEQIQILERQRELFDKHTDKLTYLELRNQSSLDQAINSIQKGIIVKKISEGLKRYIIELGKEGSLLKSRLKEITFGVEEETDLVIKDYSKVGLKNSKFTLGELSYDEITNKEDILKGLGYESSEDAGNHKIEGWRILSKTSLSEAEIASLIKEMSSLGKIIYSNFSPHQTILGEEKLNQFKEEISRVKLNY